MIKRLAMNRYNVFQGLVVRDVSLICEISLTMLKKGFVR